MSVTQNCLLHEFVSIKQLSKMIYPTLSYSDLHFILETLRARATHAEHTYCRLRFFPQNDVKVPAFCLEPDTARQNAGSLELAHSADSAEPVLIEFCKGTHCP